MITTMRIKGRTASVCVTMAYVIIPIVNTKENKKIHTMVSCRFSPPI